MFKNGGLAPKNNVGEVKWKKTMRIRKSCRILLKDRFGTRQEKVSRDLF
jgi:hypothetical protein